MKEIGRIFLLTPVVLALCLELIVPVAAEETAKVIAYNAVKNGSIKTGVLGDGNIAASLDISPGNTLEIQADVPFSWLYLQWGQAPGKYELVWEDGKMAGGEDGFLHECIRLERPVRQMKLVFSSQAALCELTLYAPGELPAQVQQWEPPSEKADMLVFPAHADDDALYFGALISYCTKYLGWDVQTVFLTSHPTQPMRSHERLDGLWELGVRNYPVVWNAPDWYSTSLEAARQQYAGYDVVGWQVEQIRRFQPEMVMGHDLNGEYGHGAHRLYAASLVEAVPLAGDSAAYPDSACKYGTWETPQTYLHLYSGQQLPLDVNQPLPGDGRTPFEVAQDAYACHKSQQWCRFSVNQKSPRENCVSFGLYQWK